VVSGWVEGRGRWVAFASCTYRPSFRSTTNLNNRNMHPTMDSGNAGPEHYLASEGDLGQKGVCVWVCVGVCVCVLGGKGEMPHGSLTKSKEEVGS
jgi:hypothetical protein